MDKRFDVICIGGAIIDLPLHGVSKDVFDVESFPVDGISMTIGGDAINEATILSRLGHKVALAGCVGDDIPGNFVLDHCRKNGIDISWMRKDPERVTSINVGLVTADGERTFITNRQGSLWKFCMDDLNPQALTEGRILSFASIFNHPLFDGKTLKALFARGKAEGMVICADMIKPRQKETLEDIRAALSYVDYFFPNYDEARLLTGKETVEDIAEVFLSCGVGHVIIKTGKKGCYARSRQETHSVPAYPDSVCIDTIGAGDNFAAGFISALLEGADFRTCTQYANAVASVSVEAPGATAGVRSAKQAKQRYQEYLAAQLCV